MLHLDADELRRRLPWPALIDALRRRFVEGCTVPPRQIYTLPDADGSPLGTSLLMPAWRAGARFGVKVVQVFPGNAGRGLPALHGIYTLFDAATGVPLATLDGTELTTRRTVAASALAAGHLARADVRTLLVVGAGRLAEWVPAAWRAVRPSIERVQVWNHRPEGARALAARWRRAGLDAQAVVDLEAAVQASDAISCVTLSERPLVRGEWLADGSHLDLVGSFTPQMRESDGACWRRARVWIDTAEVLAKSGDALQAIAEQQFDAAAVQGDLAALVRGGAARRHAHEITLFKSVGTALEDLAAAELAVDGPPG